MKKSYPTLILVLFVCGTNCYSQQNFKMNGYVDIGVGISYPGILKLTASLVPYKYLYFENSYRGLPIGISWHNRMIAGIQYNDKIGVRLGYGYLFGHKVFIMDGGTNDVSGDVISADFSLYFNSKKISGIRINSSFSKVVEETHPNLNETESYTQKEISISYFKGIKW